MGRIQGTLYMKLGQETSGVCKTIDIHVGIGDFDMLLATN